MADDYLDSKMHELILQVVQTSGLTMKTIKPFLNKETTSYLIEVAVNQGYIVGGRGGQMFATIKCATIFPEEYV